MVSNFLKLDKSGIEITTLLEPTLSFDSAISWSCQAIEKDWQSSDFLHIAHNCPTSKLWEVYSVATEVNITSGFENILFMNWGQHPLQTPKIEIGDSLNLLFMLQALVRNSTSPFVKKMIPSMKYWQFCSYKTSRGETNVQASFSWSKPLYWKCWYSKTYCHHWNGLLETAIPVHFPLNLYCNPAKPECLNSSPMTSDIQDS